MPHSTSTRSLSRLLAALAAVTGLLASIPAASAPLDPQGLARIGIDQDIGASLPLDASFRDEEGRSVRLGDYFHPGRPVVLALVYADCPMLCSMVLTGLVASLQGLSFDAGKDFEVLAVSFDPRETPARAASQKELYTRRYARPGTESGFHFLTGEQGAIARLTDAAGFHYAYDEAKGQYAHPSAILVLTPDGRVARYLYGTEYPPRDLRLAIVESSAGRLGTVTDALLLLCYRYDPAVGRYNAAVFGAVRAGGAATFLVLGGYIVYSIRSERRRRKAGRAPPGDPMQS